MTRQLAERDKIGTKGRRGRRETRRHRRAKFLIVCEGERTEPNYFAGFRLHKEVFVVYGVGNNTVFLVREAIKIRDQLLEQGKHFEQVWCVFDRDDFPVENFNAALELASVENIKLGQNASFEVAYSNQAFEIWYLLHFHFYNTAEHRSAFAEKLTKQSGKEYKKNDPEIFEMLRAKMALAIRNARKLHNEYEPHNPAYDNPCTTVYLLVEELLKNLPGQV